MADAGPVAPQAQEQRQGFLGTAFRMLLFYFVVSKVFSFFISPAKPVTQEGRPVDSQGYMNTMTEHQQFSLAVYLHPEQGSVPTHEQLIWEESGLTYDFDDSNYRTFAFNMTLTPALQSNGTLYLTATASLSSHKQLRDTIRTL